jgi:hypothetical protein
MRKKKIKSIFMKNEKWNEDKDEKDAYSKSNFDEYPFDRYRVNGVVDSINYLCRAKKCSATINIKAD